MVDCRLCEHHYRIYGSEFGTSEDIMICTIRRCIIEPETIRNGDCDVYLDRDDTGRGSL